MCKVVCQFDIRSLGCGPCAEVSGATLCDENVVLRSKAAPRTRYGAGRKKRQRAVASRRDQDVTLQGEDDAPDRYGRQTAFVVLPSRKLWFRTCCWPRAKRWCRLTSQAGTAPRGFLPPK